MIHVVTPFSRPQNIGILVDHLRPFNITWHPLIHKKIEFPKENWICPITTKYPRNWSKYAPCYHKLNTFIDAGLVDEDYYCVLCDDDLYSPDFFDIIRKSSADVIVASMVTTDGNLFRAERGNMTPGLVGFEQLIIKGRIFKSYRYKNDCRADGMLIEKVCQENEVEFVPDAIVRFNAISC